MNSQLLVIDLVGGWLPPSWSEQYIQQQLELFTVAVVSIVPEYPGLEKISALIVWERDEQLDTPRRPELNDAIHKLVKQYAKATNATVFEIRHEGRETKVSFKNTGVNNVVDFNWINNEVITDPDL